MKLTHKDFYMFRPMTGYLSQRLDDYQFEHWALTDGEINEAILDMIKAIHERDLPVSGPGRQIDWERGWAENLDKSHREGLDMSPQELMRPHYFNKHPVVRWDGELYAGRSENYEYNMLAAIQDYVFDKYFRRLNHVYEFGCGTGHNLFRVRDVNPKAGLHGFDWAESAVNLINRLADRPDLDGFSASKFDFFNPDWDCELSHSCGAYTVAALEQVGTNFHPWLNYILEQTPSVVAHIEPIGEVLNPDVLQDYLSIEYFKKRNYLSGYLDHLRLLESRGRIELQEVTRTHIGSKFIEGYTVIVWSPA